MNSKLSDAFLLFLIGPVSQPHKHHLSQGIIISQDIFKCLHLAWNSKTAIFMKHITCLKKYLKIKPKRHRLTEWCVCLRPNSPKSQSAWPGSRQLTLFAIGEHISETITAISPSWWDSWKSKWDWHSCCPRPDALFPRVITAHAAALFAVTAPIRVFKQLGFIWGKAKHILTSVISFGTVLPSVIFSRLVFV